MDYNTIHAKIKRDKSLSTRETDELIAKVLDRSYFTVRGYKTPSKVVPAQAIKLLTAVFGGK